MVMAIVMVYLWATLNTAISLRGDGQVVLWVNIDDN